MESSDKNQILFVGNHAISHLEASDGNWYETYAFVQPGIRENSIPFLLHSKMGKIPCECYDEATIEEATTAWMQNACKYMLIGDPTEWLMSGTIQAAIKTQCVSGVLFVYPVGMVALDMRKEMAELILSLKKSNIPTYLIRNPKSFFTAVEPKLNALVQSTQGHNDLPEEVEYLCGFPSPMAIG